MASDDNLYDDLDEALLQPLDRDIEKKNEEEKGKVSASKQLEEKLKENEKKCAEILSLKVQLEKNMSLLTITARAEIDR